MAITPSDFSKIWASNADTPEYTFNEADYLKGWDFVGNLPPTRAMWNAMQKSTDEKMKYVFDNFGAPLTASTVAEMTMQNRVYVYTGSETGYTAGHWYYWNGSAWADGGVYNSNTVQVDPTLTISGAAADARATGIRMESNILSISASYFPVSYLENGGITATAEDSSYLSAYRVRTKNILCFDEDVRIYSPYYVYAVNVNTGSAFFNAWSQKYLDVPKGTRFRVSFSPNSGGGSASGELSPETASQNIKITSLFRRQHRDDLMLYAYSDGHFPASQYENGSIYLYGDDVTTNADYRIRNKEIIQFPTDIILYSPSVRFYVVDALNGQALSAVYTENMITVPANTAFRLSGSYNQSGASGSTISPEQAAIDIYVSPNFKGNPISELDVNSFVKGGLGQGGIDSTYYGASRCRTIGYLTASKNIVVSHKTSCPNAKIYVYKYDKDGSYTGSGWVEKDDIKQGETFRVMLTLNPNINTEKTLDEILDAFNFSDDITSAGIDADAENLIAQAQRHFVDSGTGTDTTGLTTFAHLTDIHVDAIRFDNFLNFVRSNSMITKGIVSGDVVNTATNASEFAYIAGTTNELMYCVGNHDRGGITHDAVKGYLMPNRSNTYYYEDFGKIRVIVLDQCDQSNPDGTSGALGAYTQAQIDWFIGLLQDALTNSKHVLIVMHDPEQTPVINNMGFCQRYYRLGYVGNEYVTIAGGTIIGDIINAFKNGTSVSKTYNNQRSGTITVNTSFSGNGVFIGYVCGHYHADLLGYSPKYSDQLNLNCCLGALSNSSPNDLARVEGQRSENCFNVYVIDTAKRQIKIVRVGADHNDLLQERKKLVLNY